MKNKVLPKDSFAEKCKDGLEFWDYKKNLGLSPKEFSPQSNTKVWWNCLKGHGSWRTTIQSIYLGRRCKKCASKQSILEKQIIVVLKKMDIKVESLFKLDNDEYDIYLPNNQVIIEIDGYYYHKNKVEQDTKKSERIIKHGLKLIRIRDNRLPKIDCYYNLVYDEKEGTFTFVNV